MMPSFTTSGMTHRMMRTSPQRYGSYYDGGYASAQPPILKGAQRQDYGMTDEQYTSLPPALATRPSHLPDLQPYQASAFLPAIRSDMNPGAHVSGPLLPPIRMPELPSNTYYDQMSTKPSQQALPEKEEKVGGVAAHLDYEMDEMVDFVAEMAQGMYDIYTSRICLADIDMARSILSSKFPAGQDFRKFVSQVLSSTRLPSSTILLGLLYLQKRTALLSKRGHYGQSGVDMYSMLTIALVLGSKFLDDNTFQNRSWSEVSNISVKGLNLLEFQWLADIKWDLHIDQDDPEGFLLWRQHWQSFQNRNIDILSLANSLKQAHLEQRRPQQYQQSHRLPPLDTALVHARPGDSLLVNQAFQRPNIWNVPQHHGDWHLTPSQHAYSPSSAPETGPNTPDIHDLFDAYGGIPQPLQPPFKLPPASHILPSNGTQSDWSVPYTARYGDYMHGCYYEGCRYNAHQERSFMACA